MIGFIRYKILGQPILQAYPELLEWETGDQLEVKTSDGKTRYVFECVHPSGIIVKGSFGGGAFGQYMELSPRQSIRNATLETRRQQAEKHAEDRLKQKRSKELEQLATQYKEPLRQGLLRASAERTD